MPIILSLKLTKITNNFIQIEDLIYSDYIIFYEIIPVTERKVYFVLLQGRDIICMILLK